MSSALSRISAVIAATALVPLLHSEALACKVTGIEQIMAKPRSPSAAIVIGETIMAASLVKLCPNLKIRSECSRQYEHILDAAKKSQPKQVSELQAYSDQRAKQRIDISGCGNVLNAMGDARFTKFLLGGPWS